MPQLSQSAINELLGLIAERRAACAKDGKTSAGLESVQVAFESLMAKGQGSNLFWVRPAEQERVTAPVVPMLTPVASAGAASSPACHVLIEGDNFHALQVLQHTHRQAVDIIYIDPPYNTNRGDFRYNDTWVDDAHKWKHSLWLSFMAKRLALAKTLMTESGLIFISIDDVEVNNLKLLCDDIFGVENHVNTVVVKMSHLSGVKMAHVEKKLPKLKEFVLVYAKDKNNVKLSPIYQPTTWDEALSRYTQYIENVDAPWADWTVCPAKKAAERQGVTWANDDEREKFLIANARRIFRTARNKALPSTGVRGKFSRVQSATGLEKFVFNDEEVLFAAEKLKLVEGEFLPANALGDIWTDISINNLHNEGGVEFKNGKKPLVLIERILGLVGKKDAVVLDFFAGSGTTAQAVMDLNERDGGTRQCILVTNNEVDKETEAKLTKRGHKEGTPEWDAAGICQSVTWPRVSAVAENWSDKNSKPRIQLFKLTCLPMPIQSVEEGVRLYGAADKAEVRAKAILAQSAQLPMFAPIAWLEAGACGAYSVSSAETGHGVGFAVVRKAAELPKNPAVPLKVVYLLTDALVEQPGSSLSAAATRVASKFPADQRVKVKELWIDYMKNFPVEEK